MIKVLIVEDELLVRLGTQSTIDWEENGFEIIGSASSGMEALLILEHNQPDIVLCDLEMSPMNGIEFIHEFRKRGYVAKIIILTCHTNFEYMQDAIRLGVDDYILKATMEPKDLLDTMLKLKEKIKNARTYNMEWEKFQRQYEEHCAVMQKELLITFLIGGTTKIEYNAAYKEKGFAALGLSSPDNPYQLILFKIDRFHQYSLKSQDEQKIILRSVVTMLENSLPPSSIMLPMQTQRSEMICILRESSSALHIAHVVSSIQQKIEILLGVTLSAVYNSSPCTACELSDIFKRAADAMAEKQLYPASYTCDLSIGESLKNAAPFKLNIWKLSPNLLISDFEALSKTFYTMFEEISRHSGSKHCLMQVINKLQTVWEMYHNNFSISASGTWNERWTEENWKYDTIGSLTEWITGKFYGLSQSVLVKQPVRNDSVFKALQYIHQHYQENPSLTDVAISVHMSPSYFSHLFKQETGYSFVNYLNELKIAKAKLLLCTTDSKAAYIAREVGFEDVSYFIRAFKQSTGMTPVKFRSTVNYSDIYEKF